MRRRILEGILLLTMLSGCVTVPSGPSVRVLPSKGKSFETFLHEDSTCRNWAQSQLGSPVQETYDQNMATSAVVGTAVGAGIGAALGSASGHAGAGAALGAATGLLFGSAAGSGASEAYGAEAQHRYDNSYVQCMYTYGNQIPGARQPVAMRVAAPPEPAPVRLAPPPPPAPMLAPPPEEYEQEPPEFVYSPNLNAYVAVAVPYELVYTGNEYYYYSGGNWFRGPYYNGPWTYVPRRSYPPLFAQYQVVNIRHYRDVEYRRYRRDAGRYDGRIYRPVYRGERHRSRY